MNEKLRPRGGKVKIAYWYRRCFLAAIMSARPLRKMRDTKRLDVSLPKKSFGHYGEKELFDGVNASAVGKRSSPPLIF